jgi:hypothetical protein
MNNIDVEKLSPEELFALFSFADSHILELKKWGLNFRKVCRRINELNRRKMAEKLQEFEIGDEISFEHEGDIITGTVIRVNKKTLSIRTDRGHWYIDPRCATKIPVAFKNRWS